MKKEKKKELSLNHSCLTLAWSLKVGRGGKIVVANPPL